MNQKIKKKWIAALRSGEFNQGKGYLEKNGKYCALGVLCLLALVEGECTYNMENETGRFDNKKLSLPFNVLKWAGIAQEEERFLDLKEHEVLVEHYGRSTSIARLNDQGLSFKSIASIIEQEL